MAGCGRSRGCDCGCSGGGIMTKDLGLAIRVATRYGLHLHKDMGVGRKEAVLAAARAVSQAAAQGLPYGSGMGDEYSDRVKRLKSLEDRGRAIGMKFEIPGQPTAEYVKDLEATIQQREKNRGIPFDSVKVDPRNIPYIGRRDRLKILKPRGQAVGISFDIPSEPSAEYVKNLQDRIERKEREKRELEAREAQIKAAEPPPAPPSPMMAPAPAPAIERPAPPPPIFAGSVPLPPVSVTVREEAPPPPTKTYTLTIEGGVVLETQDMDELVKAIESEVKVGDRFEVFEDGRSTGLKMRIPTGIISIPASEEAKIRAMSRQEVQALLSKAQESAEAKAPAEEKRGIPWWLILGVPVAAVLAAS